MTLQRLIVVTTITTIHVSTLLINIMIVICIGKYILTYYICYKVWFI